MKTVNLVILLITFLVSSCQSTKKAADFKKMDWLLGTWKGEASGQPFYETWIKVSDTEFLNLNFVVCNGDTSVGERSKIEVVNDKISYTGSNNVRQLISLTDNRCTFENKQRGEILDFSLNEKNEWVAHLNYPNSQIEYKLTKTVPIDELMQNKQTPIEGHFEGYIEFNNKKLNTTADFKVVNGKQAAFLSNSQLLIFNDPVTEVCYNPPHIIFKKNEGRQIVTFTGTVQNDNIEGQISGELPARFYLKKIYNYNPVPKNYNIANIMLANDKIPLPATIYLPKSNIPTAAIIMMFGSGKHTKEEFYGFADYFASHGIATLVYDKRDVSENAYPNAILKYRGSDIVLMKDLVNDANSAFNYLKTKKEINPAKIGLWGISQGGVVAPMLISQNPSIAFTIVVSAPTTIMKECYHFQKLHRLKQRVSDVNTIRKVENLWNEFDNYIINGMDLNELKPKLDNAYSEGWGRFIEMPQVIPTEDDLKYNFSYNTLGLVPAIYWNQVDIPVYAVYGDGDIQVPVKRSIEELNRVFKNKQNLLTIKTYPNSDHLIKTIPNGDNFDFPKYTQGYLTDMMQWLIEITK